MKIKSLLLATLVAGISLSASAEKFTNCNDYLKADTVTMVAGENKTVTISLYRETSPDFCTALQFDIRFPEGITPFAVYDEDAEENIYGKATDDARMVLTNNFGNSSFYPNHRVVGVDMTARKQTKNPCEIYELYIKANEDIQPGNYDVNFHTLMYTCKNNDSYTSLDARRTNAEGKIETDYDYAQTIMKPIFTVVIETPSGVKDINVAAGKTYKTIENGQVIIVKDGVKYNTMGQIVK